ncbi:hypothetical protein AVEN_195634-1 [Araneus ventricosus]|uniref:Uncharacterized protein n=1 Tax=Araneus ventricosus TaxID=182803 RepID=A0A4Y2B9D0_ARAVE|nr:hypothetical protein AVEN_195634-1 [Araneus ventricosus]
MNHSYTSGSKHLWNVIKNSRHLTEDLKKVVDPVISRNALTAHSEKLLLTKDDNSRTCCSPDCQGKRVRKPAADERRQFENLLFARLSRPEGLLPQLNIVALSSPN